MTIAPATPLTDITEKEWSAQIVGLAKTLGWLRHHHYRSDRSEPGWPDEVFLRERLILVELKTERGKLSDAQKLWLGRLLYAGAEVYVARPRHLEPLARILAARGDPFLRRDVVEDATRLRAELREELE